MPSHWNVEHDLDDGWQMVQFWCSHALLHSFDMGLVSPSPRQAVVSAMRASPLCQCHAAAECADCVLRSLAEGQWSCVRIWHGIEGKLLLLLLLSAGECLRQLAALRSAECESAPTPLEDGMNGGIVEYGAGLGRKMKTWPAHLGGKGGSLFVGWEVLIGGQGKAKSGYWSNVVVWRGTSGQCTRVDVFVEKGSFPNCLFPPLS